VPIWYNRYMTLAQATQPQVLDTAIISALATSTAGQLVSGNHTNNQAVQSGE